LQVTLRKEMECHFANAVGSGGSTLAPPRGASTPNYWDCQQSRSARASTCSIVEGKPVLKKADGSPGPTGTLAAEGIAFDQQGNLYAAEVGPHKLLKYVPKK